MRIHINISGNRIIQVLLLFLFIVNMGGGLFDPFFAVFVKGFIVGATLKTVGFAAALYAISKSILQLPLAKKIDAKAGERDDFFVLLAGSSLGFIFTMGLLFIHMPYELYVLEIINGVGGACLAAAYYGIFARHIDRGSEGFEWSLFSVWGLTLSAAVGSMAGGIVADALGLYNTILLSGLLEFLATLGLVVLYPMLDGTRKKVDLTKLPPMA